MKVCLLDLNFTLVKNSDQKVKPFTQQIVQEEYRLDLIEKVKAMGCKVILLTARPEIHQQATLTSIQEKTGWQPDEAIFNYVNARPPILKKIALEERIMPAHPGATFFAVESNPASRGMFANHGIEALTYDKFMQ